MRIPEDLVTRIIDYLRQLADEVQTKTGHTPEQLVDDIEDLKEIVEQ